MNNHHQGITTQSAVLMSVVAIIVVFFTIRGSLLRTEIEEEHEKQKTESSTKKIEYVPYLEEVLYLNDQVWVEYPHQIEYPIITKRYGQDLLISNYINNTWTDGVIWKAGESSPFNTYSYSSHRVRYKLLNTNNGKIIVAQNKNYRR